MKYTYIIYIKKKTDIYINTIYTHIVYNIYRYAHIPYTYAQYIEKEVKNTKILNEIMQKKNKN